MNPWMAAFARWLADFYVAATLLLFVGAVAMSCIRQPVRRLAVAWATTLGLAAVAIVSSVPGWPRVPWSAAVRSPDPTISQPYEMESPPAPAGHLEEEAAAAHHVRPFPEPADRISESGRSEARNALPYMPELKPRWGPEQRVAWILGLFSGGAALVAIWLSWGAVQTVLLCRKASGAPTLLRAELAELVSGNGRLPRLLVSPSVSGAVAMGIFRPTIVLPSRFVEEATRDGLKAALAHEWAHIKNGDLWLLAVGRVLLLGLFVHPVYWWLRYRIRHDQEAVADAAASGGTDPADYAEHLLHWARKTAGLPTFCAAAALGIWERHSHLARRISMLLDERFRVETECSRRWRWGLSGVLALLALSFSIPTIRPVPAAVASPAGEEGEAGQAGDSTAEEALVFNCRVVDHDTGKGIAGATVVVRRTIPTKDPAKYKELIARTEHLTDAEGNYTVTFPPEQASMEKLYVELDVTHPDYPPREGFGYALSMIKKNLKLGERPFFEVVTLRPGRPVTGAVKTSDGKPAVGVRVLGYSNITDFRKPDGFGDYEYGSFADATTDAEGRFRFVAITPGKCVFWIVPEDRQPSSHFIDDQRGDVGAFTLEKGVVLTGRVVDAEGKPLPGVFLEARGADTAPHGMPVASAIERYAETDEQGKFSLAPLPPGDCTIIPVTHRYDRKTRTSEIRDLPAVFYHTTVALTREADPAFVEIKAAPHVTLEFQYVDSKGEPTTGWDLHLWGYRPSSQVGEDTPRSEVVWWATGRAERGEKNKGKVVMRAPQGILFQLDLVSNEHGALRLQIDENAPKLAGYRINLGLVTADMRGMRIYRYVAPIVLIRVNTPGDVQPQEIKAEGRYADHDITSVVRFEKQNDGRFRSSQLLPDEKATYTITAKGFHPVVMELPGLKEGDVHEVDATLVPDASQRKDDAAESPRPLQAIGTATK